MAFAGKTKEDGAPSFGNFGLILGHWVGDHLRKTKPVK